VIIEDWSLTDDDSTDCYRRIVDTAARATLAVGMSQVYGEPVGITRNFSRSFPRGMRRTAVFLYCVLNEPNVTYGVLLCASCKLSSIRSISINICIAPHCRSLCTATNVSFRLRLRIMRRQSIELCRWSDKWRVKMG